MATLPRLHAVTDERVAARPDFLERAGRLAEAGGPGLAVHLRPRLEGGAWLALARRLREALGETGAWLVINDRADVARSVGGQAVQSGRTGLDAADIRRVAPTCLVGRSVHSPAEATAAVAEGADYLLAGPVFATASHEGGGREPAGLDLVREAARLGPPVVAIGGMDPERARAAIVAGAYGVAAIRALWDPPDPRAQVAAFVAALVAPEPILLKVNGEDRSVPGGSTLADLLGRLGLDPRTVVVERNRRIVRRAAIAGTPLADGDAIEIVHFVGGG